MNTVLKVSFQHVRLYFAEGCGGEGGGGEGGGGEGGSGDGGGGAR